MSDRIHGVITAIITPFTTKARQINEKALEEYLEFLINKKVNGLFIGGTTGEGLLLSVNERKTLFSFVTAKVNNKIPVIAHVGDVCTDNAVTLAKSARDVGINTISAVLPYFYPLDEQAIFSYFASIATSVPDLSVYAYNLPGSTLNNLSVDLFKRLTSEIENFVGVKNSSPDFLLLKDYLYVGEDKYNVLVGCDGLDFSGLLYGAQGLISGNSSMFPEPFIRLYEAVKVGDINTGMKMQRCIDELRVITHDGKYLSVFKMVLSMRGLPVGGVRGSLRELTKKEEEKLKKEVHQWALKWEIEM